MRIELIQEDEEPCLCVSFGMHQIAMLMIWFVIINFVINMQIHKFCNKISQSDNQKELF